ncbi:hypothetical protein MNEG_15433, partial [Monoraphidium neglectum]
LDLAYNQPSHLLTAPPRVLAPSDLDPDAWQQQEAERQQRQRLELAVEQARRQHQEQQRQEQQRQERQRQEQQRRQQQEQERVRQQQREQERQRQEQARRQQQEQERQRQEQARRQQQEQERQRQEQARRQQQEQARRRAQQAQAEEQRARRLWQQREGAERSKVEPPCPPWRELFWTALCAVIALAVAALAAALLTLVPWLLGWVAASPLDAALGVIWRRRVLGQAVGTAAMFVVDALYRPVVMFLLVPWTFYLAGGGALGVCFAAAHLALGMIGGTEFGFELDQQFLSQVLMLVSAVLPGGAWVRNGFLIAAMLAVVRLGVLQFGPPLARPINGR